MSTCFVDTHSHTHTHIKVKALFIFILPTMIGGEISRCGVNVQLLLQPLNLGVTRTTGVTIALAGVNISQTGVNIALAGVKITPVLLGDELSVASSVLSSVVNAKNT